MYAVIRTGGKQYRVSEGDSIKVEKLTAEVGQEVHFGEVLWIEDENGVQVGTPILKDARVTGKVTRQGKAGKILVFKFKRRKMYRRKRGHRQQFAEVQIDRIIKTQPTETIAQLDSVEA